MKIHKVAVIGGTGKSGKYLVDNLLQQGFHLKLLLRHPEKHCFKNPLIETIKGDARDYNSVLRCTEDCQAIISTLGQPKGEKPIFSQASENIIKSVQKNGFSRYIGITGLNVNTPSDQKDERIRYATQWMYDNFPETTRDKQQEYEYLTQNRMVDWTLVRLPLIIQTDEHFPIQTSLENCKGDKISASDLADFLVSQLRDKSYIQKSPFLYNI